jgi:uncharacterized protein with HEPN domain
VTAVEALADILFHVRGVRDMMDGVDFQRFTTTYALWCAAERAGEIIGTRVKQLPPDILAAYPEVQRRELIALTDLARRPRLTVDMALRWSLASKLIPLLEAPVAAMLEEARRTSLPKG